MALLSKTFFFPNFQFQNQHSGSFHAIKFNEKGKNLDDKSNRPFNGSPKSYHIQFFLHPLFTYGEIKDDDDDGSGVLSSIAIHHLHAKRHFEVLRHGLWCKGNDRHGDTCWLGVVWIRRKHWINGNGRADRETDRRTDKQTGQCMPMTLWNDKAKIGIQFRCLSKHTPTTPSSLASPHFAHSTSMHAVNFPSRLLEHRQFDLKHTFVLSFRKP